MGKIKEFMTVGFSGGSTEPVMIKLFCIQCKHEWLEFLQNGIVKGQCSVECPKGCGDWGVPCEEDEL